jgi:hypothetical protein
MLYKYRYTDRRNDIMSRELLSNIEAGCYGKMKVENGKIVFECITTNNTIHPPHYPPPSVPAPSAPPLVEDTLIIDELRDELRETKERLASLEKQVQQFFNIRAKTLHEKNKTFENLLAGGVVHLENELEAAAPPNPAASTPPYMLPTTTKFSLVALQSRSPETASCDPTRRHHYLSDVDFQKVFRMSAIDFGKLPGWMQIERKKMLHLF